MLVEVRVPQLAESISEATVAAWHRNVGDMIKRGENLCDLETDKVTLEVAAPEDGMIREISVAQGTVVQREAILAVLDTEAVMAPVAMTMSMAASPEAAATSVGPATSTAPSAAPAKLSPAVRKMVAETPINLDVVPHAQADRITKADVLSYLGTEAGDADVPQAGAAPIVAGAYVEERRVERVPMTRLRKRAAERLLAAQQSAALLTTFNEFNLHRINALRETYKESFEKRHGVRLGLMSVFVRAVVAALKRFPIINAAVDGDDILYHNYFDIGIAVASPRGLVVPILRDVDQLGFAEIELAIRAFGERARDNKLGVDDLTGGTFTITNGGVFGSLLSTPIVNPPQSAILGMHKVEQRPVAENGQVVIRPMMYVALSYDHRIIDGKDAVGFLVAVKEYVEEPERILIGL